MTHPASCLRKSRFFYLSTPCPAPVSAGFHRGNSTSDRGKILWRSSEVAPGPLTESKGQSRCGACKQSQEFFGPSDATFFQRCHQCRTPLHLLRWDPTAPAQTKAFLLFVGALSTETSLGGEAFIPAASSTLWDFGHPPDRFAHFLGPPFP